MMPSYSRCKTNTELEKILQLQKRNLYTNISTDEKAKEGFVTVNHDLEILERMNSVCPHILAWKGEVLAGYALCMDPLFSEDIEVLKPMFKKVQKLIGKEARFMVMGQICIDKPYRKQGIFKGLYNYMRAELQASYTSIITEVDDENSRSLNAHYAVGFKDLLIYPSGDRIWHLVQWEI